MNELKIENSQAEQGPDYEGKLLELKGLVDRVLRSQIKNPEFMNKMIVFTNGLKSKYGEDFDAYRTNHILSSSTLKEGERDKTFAELKAEGRFKDFDFPGEDSVEEFLTKLTAEIED